MEMQAAKDALKKYFGYDEFRPLQDEIIASVLAGQDGLVLMPTGGGKSICYQIPAIVLSGMCVVVSPLISLMKDQVEGLRANGIRAAFINSAQTYKQQQEVIEDALMADIKLLYVSPEKMVSTDFMNILSSVKISLFAIDEAHCISSWGHDFRPEYTKLSFLKRRFPQVPVIALTATADKLTRRDIVHQLGLPTPRQFIASFDRPNLSLNVLPGQQRFQVIRNFINLRPNQSGIIYCLSRKETEKLSEKLNNAGINAAYYHAGMGPKYRAKIQEDFIKDETPIICATIAFGMGIDKSNVRWVIHYNLPKNIEGYYQEIGRGGRDGLPSETLLFYSYADVMRLRQFAEESGQPKIQLAKLDRMQQYAEAAICRRKILLSYFGEHLSESCGNCDVCENPPKQFDGTVLAQKALSAVARAKETIGISLLIDVLRGSARKEIFERKLHEVKTYGAGSDMAQAQWQEIILQLLHLGLLEIAYDQGNVLRLTQASWDVLKGQREIQMVHFQTYSERNKARKEKARPQSKKEAFQEALFQNLRDLRSRIAKQFDMAPYLIFTDKTLKAMAEQSPTTQAAMLSIEGVGEAKNKQYGKAFRQRILKFIFEETQSGQFGFKPTGSTYLQTYYMYQQGDSPDEIAQARKISARTVYTHLARLLEEGYELNISTLLNRQELAQVGEAYTRLGKIAELKPYYEFLGGQLEYEKIRIGLAYWTDQQNNH
ncbi:MAG: DNA helicase RecQ [Bacteroidota bacterium]